MQILRQTIVIIVINLFLSIQLYAFRCWPTNDHLNYTCVGHRNFYGFTQLTIGKTTREKIIRASFFDCQEDNIPSEPFNLPSLKYLTISCGVQSINENAFGNLNGLLGLNLSSNAIDQLPVGVFKRQTILENLNLTNNNLKALTQNSLEGLSNLKRLHISYNSIYDLNFKSLSPSKYLEELYLDNNKIKVIPTVFFGTLTRLHTLDLSHNAIEALGDLLFSFTSNLQRVNLSYNLLQAVPILIFQSTRLRVLDLSHNQLSAIYEDALKLSTIEELYLQNNKIVTFEVKAKNFKDLPMSVLDVRYNRLTFLDEGFLRVAENMLTLKIEGNPWDCNCLEKMEALLREDIKFDLSDPFVNGEESLCVTSSSSKGCNIK